MTILRSRRLRITSSHGLCNTTNSSQEVTTKIDTTNPCAHLPAPKIQPQTLPRPPLAPPSFPPSLPLPLPFSPPISRIRTLPISTNQIVRTIIIRRTARPQTMPLPRARRRCYSAPRARCRVTIIRMIGSALAVGVEGRRCTHENISMISLLHNICI